MNVLNPRTVDLTVADTLYKQLNKNTYDTGKIHFLLYLESMGMDQVDNFTLAELRETTEKRFRP